jgi:rare lipoprotein A
MVCFVFMGGCVGHYQTSPSLDQDQPAGSERGMASWYGPSFHGKPSASGERYDMWALTAAHQTLPFGTWVKVKKVSTGETVTVRINDRGPFIKGRIIDLSYAAARELTMIGEGTAEVILTILDSQNSSLPSQVGNKQFWVQAGAFATLTEAMTLRERLAQDYEYVRVQTVNLSSGEWHRVQVGTYSSRKASQAVSNTLKKELGVQSLIVTNN